MLTDHTRATIKGAAECQATPCDFRGWTMPDGDIFKHAYHVGRQLGLNTPNAELVELLPVLLDQCDQHFPIPDDSKQTTDGSANNAG